jgi:hypothetical protein
VIEAIPASNDVNLLRLRLLHYHSSSPYPSKHWQEHFRLQAASRIKHERNRNLRKGGCNAEQCPPGNCTHQPSIHNLISDGARTSSGVTACQAEAIQVDERFPYRWLLPAFLLNAYRTRRPKRWRFSVVRSETAKNPVFILSVLFACYSLFRSAMRSRHVRW